VDGADWLKAQLSTFDCASCGRTYAAGSIRVLAQREELFFVDLACPSCGSGAVAIVTIEVDEASNARVDVGDLAPDAPVPGSVSAHGAPPVSGDDLLDVHRFLREFDGDFRALFSGEGTRGHLGGD
jgi:hypothetical protein